jgi:hypothetical protein
VQSSWTKTWSFVRDVRTRWHRLPPCGLDEVVQGHVAARDEAESAAAQRLRSPGIARELEQGSTLTAHLANKGALTAWLW